GPARPEILRRVHVRIRRDDALAAHRSILLLVADDEEGFSVAGASGSSDRSILRRVGSLHSPGGAGVGFAAASASSRVVLGDAFAFPMSLVRLWRRAFTTLRAFTAFLLVPAVAGSFACTCFSSLAIFFFVAFLRSLAPFSTCWIPFRRHETPASPTRGVVTQVWPAPLDSQRSSSVQASPSSQFGAGLCTHCPLPGSQ